ncbi:endonuclease 8-like 1 isoform X2 [Pollicipes pollicipes]|uniref:endonuclease 8-like 1 isoform X2 n=1 Tax=Pollicipes pollicipes TaxID=41117 RepID=UPI0018852C38|nr:endonuclease 8-like 1 isoform X2 [Pollicipes pollicipes]
MPIILRVVQTDAVMPEGPELHLSSLFIKRVSDSKSFIGKIVERLPANREPRLVDFNKRLGDNACYTLTSWSRGKELMLTVKPLKSKYPNASYKPEEWTIRFNFGMTGCFKFTKTADTPKHAKVCFRTAGEPSYTLSFVDMRGFGRWVASPEWSKDRGPCILQEADLFRANVLDNLAVSVFNKPICEAMLDQRYFNGVGNYLRAEVLHRLSVRPFESARDVLAPLPLELKVGQTDVLHMCHQLATEVVTMGGGKRYDVQLEALEPQPAVKKEEGDEVDAFEAWLQCYHQPGMKNLVDNNGRTIWFAGSPGPRAPKDGKARHSPKKRASSKVPKSKKRGEENNEDDLVQRGAKAAAGKRTKAASNSRKRTSSMVPKSEEPEYSDRAKNLVNKRAKVSSRENTKIPHKISDPEKSTRAAKRTKKSASCEETPAVLCSSTALGHAQSEEGDRRTRRTGTSGRRSLRLAGRAGGC